MSEVDRPKIGVNDAANIKAFLSMIPHAGKFHAASSVIDGAASKVGELNIDEEKTSDTKTSSAEVSAVGSTVASKAASPESKASDALPPEKISDWIHENAPPNHFKTKNPLVEAVQAQDSPRATGVLAPPPTPETISNLAIGQIISDELDKIPEDRILSLGDSRWAPKYTSGAPRNTQSTAKLASSEQFLSAIPRSTKPRDDQNFSRMSFKAAEFSHTPVPNVFQSDAPAPSKASLSPTTFIEAAEAPHTLVSDGSGSNAAAPLKASLTPTTSIKGAEAPHIVVSNGFKSNASVLLKTSLSPTAPEWRPSSKENTPHGKANDSWFQTPAINGTDKIKLSPTVPSSIAPHLRKVQANGSDSQGKVKHEVASLKKDDEDVEESSLPKALFSYENSSNGYETVEMAGGALTPSSMTFTAVSPTKVRAAGITTAAQPAKIVGEDLEGALYFKAWPKVEERSPRTVYGGPLEDLAVGNSTAYVTFLHAEDTAKFYETTANGLVYKTDAANHVIFTEMSKDVNPVSGVLREYIEKEFTRCVRAVGVDKEWTMGYLQETAARKGRRVEKIVDGVNVSNVRASFGAVCHGYFVW
ncbi:MAG: hypothetical protein Q9218_000407 [Villophora microphyllina]